MSIAGGACDGGMVETACRTQCRCLSVVSQSAYAKKSKVLAHSATDGPLRDMSLESTTKTIALA